MSLLVFNGASRLSILTLMFVAIHFSDGLRPMGNSTNSPASLTRIRNRLDGSRFGVPHNDPVAFYDIVDKLRGIDSEKDGDRQTLMALELGSKLSTDGSIRLSEAVKGYIFNILSNITSVGNRKTTGIMLDKLTDLFQAENEVYRFNYTEHRMQDTDEQRLLRILLLKYEKAVRPLMNASGVVELEIGLTLNQIDVNEKHQVLTALVWLDQEWYDEKLVWDPMEYNNFTVLRIPCDLIWLPDVVLYNSVEDLREGYMRALTMVGYNGNVFWPPIVKFKGACEIKIRYFPYDDQICKLKLGSWAYDGHQVMLNKRKQGPNGDGIDLTNYQPNGEWMLLNVTVERNEVYYTCCEAPYLDVTFTLYLRRRTLYYTYNIVIPCVMLSILTLLCFWMKPDSGEKISLGLTILLAFSVFMLLIAENMPSTSVQVPIIGIYITSSMCITAFSVIVGVFVANINHQADGDSTVPYWLHRFCYGVAKVVCVKMASWEERHFNIKKLAFVSQKLLLPQNRPKRVSTSHRKSVSKLCAEREASISIVETHLANQESKKLLDNDDTHEMSSDPLLKRLHTIIEHQEDLLQKQNRSEDWHIVAIVVDRCLFWIYLLMMLSTTIGCLVIFPMTKDPSGIE